MAQALISTVETVAELTRVAKTVLFADVVDSVRLLETDEEDAIRRWVSFVDAAQARIQSTGTGRLVKRMGDGLLAEFEDVRDAAYAALQLRETLSKLNEPLQQPQRIELRTGLASGQMLRSSDEDLYGRTVNLAARLAAAARPGQIIADASVRDALANDPGTDFEDIGQIYLKNVTAPVQAYLLCDKDMARTIVPRISAEDLLPTVAVMPILVPGDADTANVWSDLITEDLIVALSRSTDMNVISRLSTLGYRSARQSLADVRAQLSADYVLSGSCSLRSKRTVLDLALAETRGGLVIWSDRLVFLQNEVLESSTLFGEIANSLHAAILNREMNRTLSSPLPSLEGYALYFGAVALMNRLSRRDFDFAGELLDSLIERIPHAPASLAMKARWHVLKVQQGWADDLMREARLALDFTGRALDIDPQNTAALVAAGFVHNNLLHDLTTAEEYFDSALEITPNDVNGRALRAALFTFRGEGARATRDAERALHLAPLDPNRFFIHAMAAGAGLADNDNERALELANSSLRLNRAHTSTLRIKAVAEWRLGQAEQARATIARLMASQPGFSISWWRRTNPAAGFQVGSEFAQSLRELGVPE